MGLFPFWVYVGYPQRFQDYIYMEHVLKAGLALGGCYTHIYSTKKGSPWQTNVQVPSKLKLVNQWVLVGFLTKSRKNSKTTASPKLTPDGWQMAKAGNLEHPTHPLGSSTGQRMSFTSESVVPNLFLAVGLAVRVFFAAWIVWVLYL